MKIIGLAAAASMLIAPTAEAAPKRFPPHQVVVSNLDVAPAPISAAGPTVNRTWYKFDPTGVLLQTGQWNYPISAKSNVACVPRWTRRTVGISHLIPGSPPIAWRSVRVRWCWRVPQMTITQVFSEFSDDTDIGYCWRDEYESVDIWGPSGFEYRAINKGKLGFYTPWPINCAGPSLNINARVYVQAGGGRNFG